MSICRWHRDLRSCLFLAALIGYAALARAGAAESMTISGIQRADMDIAVRPQDELFGYANGTWLREVAIPNDRSRYGVDTTSNDRA
jgi:hypothetical protein